MTDKTPKTIKQPKIKKKPTKSKGTVPKKIEMVGFEAEGGHLLVVADSGKRNENKEILWRCVCGCGREVELTTNILRKGQKSCGKCKKVERTKIKKARYSHLLRNSTRRAWENLTPSDKYALIDKFLSGKATIPDLEKEWNITTGSLRNHLKRFQQDLTVGLDLATKIHEVNMVPGSVEPVNTDQLIKSIIEANSETKLDKLVSEANSAQLTPNELTFAWLLHSTGSITTALSGSDFLSCLTAQSSPFLTILGQYLVSKPNIKSYLQKLNSDRELELDVTKDFVQNEIVTQIYQLKDRLALDPDTRSGDRGYLLKAIEMLGKTVGAFQDRLMVEEVDPGRALDKLIEVAKRTSGETNTDANYEVLDVN